MNLDETATQRRFRTEVREWIAAELPEGLRHSEEFADRVAIDRRLAEHGYLAFTWPSEFGGRDGDPIFAHILDEERGQAGIPVARSPSRFGVNLLGPTLMVHGTEEQQRRFLAPILSVSEIWCQGFSEPEAGSDLANVRTTAEVDGDQLVISGSKVWITQSREADYCFALVRTDREAPRHRNLSFVLIPMDAEGIDLRPLVQLTGDAEFSEVFFDDVRVPRDNVVGELGEGWKVAMTTLTRERTYSQISRFRLYERQVKRLATMLRGCTDARRRQQWLAEVGRVYADLTGIRDISHRVVSAAAGGEATPDETAITKLWWSQTHQRLADLGLRVATATGQDEEFWYRVWLEARAETIYAGASEIQRNIVGERVLGLPRA